MDAGAGAGAGGAPRFAAVFAVLAAGVVMANLDLFIVNVALPSIGQAFPGTGLSALSWVLNAYAIVFAALLVPAGRAADRTSRRAGFLIGVAVFAAASAICAVAGNVWVLVGARALQAAGGALLMSASLGLLLAAAPPAKRVAAVRGWSAVGGAAAALGPVLGGLLVAVSWRWVFLVNLPVAAVTIAAGLRLLPDSRQPAPGPRPDTLGVVGFTGAVGLLALGLVKAPDWGWSSAGVWGSLAAAVLLMIWCVRRSGPHPAPVVELALLREPVFAAATVASALFAVAFAAMLLSRTLWCQQVWHWSALRTGLAIAPGPVMVPFLAVGVGPLARRVGAGPVAAAGCLVFALGVGYWRVALGLHPHYASGLLPGMLLTGIGVGVALPTLVSAGVAGLPAHRFATGSGVVTMARQVGSVLGVAVLVTALGVPHSAPALLRAFDRGCDVTAAAALIAAAACLLLTGRRPVRSPAPPPAPQPADQLQ